MENVAHKIYIFLEICEMCKTGLKRIYLNNGSKLKGTLCSTKVWSQKNKKYLTLMHHTCPAFFLLASWEKRTWTHRVCSTAQKSQSPKFWCTNSAVSWDPHAFLKYDSHFFDIVGSELANLLSDNFTWTTCRFAQTSESELPRIEHLKLLEEFKVWNPPQL